MLLSTFIFSISITQKCAVKMKFVLGVMMDDRASCLSRGISRCDLIIKMTADLESPLCDSVQLGPQYPGPHTTEGTEQSIFCATMRKQSEREAVRERDK